MRKESASAARALVMLVAIVASGPADPQIVHIADTPSTPAAGKAPNAAGGDADKKVKQTPFVKKVFKDLRPGQCKSPDRGAPNTSWPVRGDAAVSFCR
jgi:hypothetical protein